MTFRVSFHNIFYSFSHLCLELLSCDEHECACMNVSIIYMDQLIYHGKKETHHHKKVVVSCEGHSHSKNKLAQAGSHQNGPSTNSGKWESKSVYIKHDFHYLQKTLGSFRQQNSFISKHLVWKRLVVLLSTAS